ncbi:unnamed protein product, partial [Brenthis ino]
MELLQYIILICALYFVEAKFLHLNYQYDEGAKVWLKLHNMKTSWHEARKMCNMEGAILASPLDETLKGALVTYSKAYGIDRLYVGIHATFSSQIWHSIEGIPLENLADHLDINQMESSDYRICAVMEAGSLINVGCQQMFPYICYKSDNVSRELTSCGTTDTAYQLDKRTGNCYKFHAEARSWIEAYETCFAEQAYLAIINSYAEAQILQDIFANHPSNTIHADHPNVMSIGMIDWEHNRDWYTIHGERIRDAGYASWSRGEPNNADRIEYCGAIFRNGLLNDEPCSKQNVFICEKDVRFVQKEDTTEKLSTTESSENLYTTESAPSINLYTTESESIENLYTTESAPSKNLYTTESESSENLYTTESESSDNLHTTESEFSENLYTTESTPSKNLYTTESEPTENLYTIETESSENLDKVESKHSENLYTTELEPNVQTELTFPEEISELSLPPRRLIVVDNEVYNSERPYTTHKIFTDK